MTPDDRKAAIVTTLKAGALSHEDLALELRWAHETARKYLDQLLADGVLGKRRALSGERYNGRRAVVYFLKQAPS